MSESRKPLLDDDDMVRDNWDENAVGERMYWSERWENEEVRDFYEGKIDDGTLILSDDLIAFLDAQIDQCKKNIFNTRTISGETRPESLFDGALAVWEGVRLKYQKK